MIFSPASIVALSRRLRRWKRAAGADHAPQPPTARWAMRSSCLPTMRTLTDIDFSFKPSVKREQLESMHTLGFLERKENVVFLGPPGVGKTHLDISLAIAAAENGRPTTGRLAITSSTFAATEVGCDSTPNSIAPSGYRDRRRLVTPSAHHGPAPRRLRRPDGSSPPSVQFFTVKVRNSHFGVDTRCSSAVAAPINFRSWTGGLSVGSSQGRRVQAKAAARPAKPYAVD